MTSSCPNTLSINTATSNTEAGFSLIEVVIAVGIFSFSMAVLLPTFSQSYVRIDQTSRKQTLLELAESKLLEVSLSKQRLPASLSGEDLGAQWEVSGDPYKFEDIVSAKAVNGIAYIYRVEVTPIPEQSSIGNITLQKVVWID